MSDCLKRGTLRHGACLLLTMCAAHAQSGRGFIDTRSIGVRGVTAVDAQQNVYIAAGGGCVGLPVSCHAIEVLKVNAAGQRTFDVTLGSSVGPQTVAKDITVDAAGDVYVAGTADLSPGGTDVRGFIAKVNGTADAVMYLTYLPAPLATPAAVRVDAQGSAYVGGATADGHPVVARLSADGSQVLYSVIFAGPGKVNALAVDAAGNAVVTGQTSSANFPATANALQPNYPGAASAFVARLDSSGKVVYSSFLGGSGGAAGTAVQLDAAGNIYVAGDTAGGFPTTPGTYEPVPAVPMWSGGTVGFVAKLKPDGSAIVWATYRETSSVFPYRTFTYLAVNAAGEVYLATNTGAGLPVTPSAPQPCFGEFFDVMTMHLNAAGQLADATYFGQRESSVMAIALAEDGSVLEAINTAENGPLLARVQWGGPGWTAPACLSPDVVNAATLTSGEYVAPGEFVTLTGFGIGPDTADVHAVEVTVNGVPAPVLYAQSRQVNTQIPFETTGSKASVVLTYNGFTFRPNVMDVNPFTSQGLFRLHPGLSTQAAAINQDGTINSTQNPAPPGSIVALYGTGYGPLNTACATGNINPQQPTPLAYTGAVLASGDVTYAGSAFGLLCGVVQINVRVPANAPPGPYPVATNFQGRIASTIAVR